MIIKTLFIAAGSIATVAAGYTILSATAPDTAARIESVVRDRGLGWDDAACQANPTGCLNSRFDKLQSLERDYEVATNAIRGEIDRVARLVAEQEELVGKNAMFLEQGRALHKERQARPDEAITFAGRSYPNLATLKAQLQLLFEEKAALEASLSSARELSGQMRARFDKLMIEAGQIALAKRVIPAQLQLIRANRALGEFNVNVGMIDGVIRGSEAGLKQSRQLIGTTRDLMAPASPKGRPGASQDAFDAFLKN